MAQTTQQWLPQPGAPVRFLPVPGSLFRHGRRPPFALFDAHQQLLGPEPATTAYISPGDQPALATFVAMHLPTFLQDAGIPWTDTAWAVFHTFSSEVARVYGYAPASVPNAHLVSATDAVLTLARTRPAAVFHAASEARDAGSAPVAEAVTRALLTALLAQECARLGGPPPRDVVLGAVFAKVGDDVLGRVPTSITAPTPPHETASEETLRYTMNTMHAQRPPLSAIALRAATQFRDARSTPRAHTRHQVPAPVEARMVAIAAACTEQYLAAPAGEPLVSFGALQRLTRDTRFDPALLRAFVTTIARAQAADVAATNDARAAHPRTVA